MRLDIIFCLGRCLVQSGGCFVVVEVYGEEGILRILQITFYIRLGVFFLLIVVEYLDILEFFFLGWQKYVKCLFCFFLFKEIMQKVLVFMCLYFRLQKIVDYLDEGFLGFGEMGCFGFRGQGLYCVWFYYMLLGKLYKQ